MKRIAFYSEKERVGKTTLTLLIAMALKNKFQLNPVIFDFDGHLVAKRADEIVKLQNIPAWSDKVKNCIAIHPVKTWEEYTKTAIFLEKDKDIALFDLKEIGEEQIQFLLNCNYIFIVSESDSEKEFKLEKEQYRTFQSIRYSDVVFEKVFMVFNKSAVKQAEKIRLDVDEVLPIIENREFFKDENISTVAFSHAKSITALAGEVYKIVFEKEQQYYQ